MWKVIPEVIDGFFRKFLRKAFAEGSAEGNPRGYTDFVEGSRGRFLGKVPRKVFAEGSAEGSRGRSKRYISRSIIVDAAWRRLGVVCHWISMWLGVACALSVAAFQCGSASHGRCLSLHLDAARRRLGVVVSLDFCAARLRLGDVCHWIGWILMNSDAF